MSEMDLGDEAAEEQEEFPIEADPADAAEQQRRLRDSDDTTRRELPLDVDPGDAAEQDRVVAGDDDEDYR